MPEPALTPTEIDRWQNPETIRRVLRSARTIAVVGCSADPEKDSHLVAAYLQRAGYRIIPVSPKGGNILGEIVYRSLPEVTEHVDLVDCFRPPAELPGIVGQAIAIHAAAVWFQFGLIHRAAATQAEAAGIDIVVDRCTKIEHRRLS